MKSIFILMSFVLSSPAFAAQSVDGIYSKEADKVIGKIGKGLVYKNGKAVMRKERECSLLRQSFETEATDRDVLVIGYGGSPIKYNDFGVYPQGAYVNGKTFWEAGVYYDAATTETKTKVEDGVRYEVCYGKTITAFANACTDDNFRSRSAIEITSKGVVMTSESLNDDGSTETWKSTCVF